MAKKQNKLQRLRNSLELKQQQFWQRIGVTQSGGSRYENGRRMPAPVRILLDIAYGDTKRSDKAYDRLRA